MDNLTLFHHCYQLITETSATYNSDGEWIKVPAAFEAQIQQFPIVLKTQAVPGGFRVDKNQFPFDLYWSKEEFYKKHKSFKRDIGIVNTEEQDPSFFRLADSTTFIHTNQQDHNYFFVNARAYLELLAFLKDEGKKADGNYEFVDWFDGVGKRIIFISDSGEGRLIVPFHRQLPELGTVENFELAVEDLKSAFGEENKNYPKFIKNELISHLKRINEKERIQHLLTDLNTILDNAKLNFNVYLHGLSIDEIKSEYRSYKDKYFDQLNGVLGKLTNQIIALPITVLGAAYAIDKVVNSEIVLVLILIAIVIVSFFLILTLRIYKSDVLFIEQSFKADYQELAKNPFFKENPKEWTYFEKIERKFTQRIKLLKQFIHGYYWLMTFFDLLLISFILFNLLAKPAFVIGIVVVLLVFFLALFSMALQAFTPL